MNNKELGKAITYMYTIPKYDQHMDYEDSGEQIQYLEQQLDIQKAKLLKDLVILMQRLVSAE